MITIRLPVSHWRQIVSDIENMCGEDRSQIEILSQVTEETASVRYVLDNDDDGHWYLIPIDLHSDWIYTESPEMIDGIIPINGPPNVVTFQAPLVRGEEVPS